MFSHFVYVNNIKTKYKINWGHFLRYEPRSQSAQIMYIFTYFCKSTVRARAGLEISWFSPCFLVKFALKRPVFAFFSHLYGKLWRAVSQRVLRFLSTATARCVPLLMLYRSPTLVSSITLVCVHHDCRKHPPHYSVICTYTHSVTW
jgi:hypothetical protein